MKRFQNSQIKVGAYSLIEALVASSVLLIGISAAASLSLSMVTQEEINERSVQVFNYLDNAARLYQLGVDASDIPGLLPPEPLVTSLTFTPGTENVSGIGTVPVTTIEMTYRPSGATSGNSSSTLDWVGGDKDITRTESVVVLRTETHLGGPLPRVDYVKNNP